MFKNKSKPLKVDLILDINYNTVTVRSIIMIDKKAYNTISILSLKEIESWSIYDKHQFEVNNLNTKLMLEDLYKK
jgi:hypothetical protein